MDVRSFDETRAGVHGQTTISMLATSVVLDGGFNQSQGSWLVAGRRTYADKVLKALGKDALPYYFADLQAHLSYRLGTKTTFVFTTYNGRDDITADIAAADNTADGGGLTFWWGNRVTGASVTHAFSDRVSATQRASYTLFRTSLNLGDGALELEDKVSEAALHGSLDFKVGERHALSAGYDVARNDLVYTVGSSSSDAQLLDERQHPASLGAYVSDIWKPSERLILEPGLRYEVLTGSGWNGVSPRLSAKYFLTKDLALTAAVGRYSQWLHSLAREDIPIRLFDFWTSSDRETSVSRATHYVLGGERWLGRDRFLRLETYVKHYDRLVEPNPADDPSVHGDEYRSLTGRSYGADLLLRQIERDRWGGWVAYTYTFSNRSDGTTNFYPGQDRRNNLNIVTTYRLSDKTLLSGRFGFATGTPYTDIIGEMRRPTFDPSTGQWDTQRRPDTQAVGGERNASRLPSTQRLDFTLTRDFGRRLKLTPFVSLINAYNAHNVFMYTFDYSGNPPTRTAYSQLPLLPTFGVTAAW
jgi:hypothetical protein